MFTHRKNDSKKIKLNLKNAKKISAHALIIFIHGIKIMYDKKLITFIESYLSIMVKHLSFKFS
jgi:hypothetical protein